MRALLPALVIGTMVAMASACVEGLESEGRGMSSSTGPDRGDVSGRSAGRVIRVNPMAPKPAEPSLFDTRVGGPASEARDDAGPDSDAGADPQTAEFERAILFDCTETSRCNGPANNIPACVVRVRQALNAAPPQRRQVFEQNVMRCRALQACSYVDCVTNKGQ